MSRFFSKVFLVSLIFILPNLAEAQDNKSKTDQLLPLDSAKLPKGDYVGIIKSLPGQDRLFMLEVEIKTAAPSGSGVNPSQVGQLAAAQQQIAAARSPQLRQQAVNNYNRLLAQLSKPSANNKINQVKREIEFQFVRNPKFRTMILPDRFDDKGNPKRLSVKEIEKLRGKEVSLPGYESSLDQLKEGQKVAVTLAAVSSKSPPPKDDNGSDEKKMQVKVIAILEEAPAKPKDKKK
ncbi:MAG: hypothetical protein ACKO23_04185 [Gemmataceae bacterium]